LDTFERTNGILYFSAQNLIGATSRQPVELLDGLLPREQMGSEARIVLKLVLDNLSVLEPDGDRGRIFPGYSSVYSCFARTQTFFSSPHTSL
jgi:hypothetical protein